MNSARAEYRELYRLTLWFRHDQRVPLRAYLRSRASPAGGAPPDAARRLRTLEFARAAARRHGLERRIVAGLAEHLASLHSLERRALRSNLRSTVEWNKKVYKSILEALNESHGISL